MSAFLRPEDQFMGVPAAPSPPEDAGVVVIPVPYERTSSYGLGSAQGPAAIVSASHQVELHDTELGFDPWAATGGIATLEPLCCDEYESGQALAADLQAIAGRWLDAGKKVVTLAGEHTGVVGSIRAHAERTTALTILQLDAHSDLRQVYAEDPWNHACTMARVFDFHTNIVQVGIRSEAAEERAFAERHGIPVFRGERIIRDDRRGSDWIAPIIAACSRRVYITIDADVLDATTMPATGTPEPGGLDWIQITGLLRRVCREREVVGFDLSEVAPISLWRFPEFLAAKLVYRLIGTAFGASVDDPVESGGRNARRGSTGGGEDVFATHDFSAREIVLELEGSKTELRTSRPAGQPGRDSLRFGPNPCLNLYPPGAFVDHSCAPSSAVADRSRLVALRRVRAGEVLRCDDSPIMDGGLGTLSCL